MTRLRWIKKGPMLIALLGLLFLGADPARAQEAKTSGEARNLTVTPLQAREPLGVRVTLDDQPDAAAGVGRRT